ncbi:hypothetical protein [Atrimonas thermophila]|uniref:hypothetical protein n=1 Tax=Atrimonas thermophila TaxID=3064161 RepID=UPI00399D0DD0
MTQRENKMRGAFVCTLSEEDWKTTRELGIYGNRFYKEGTSHKLRDIQQLSIIRDLVSMREDDVVFFHIRGKQTIHGIYKVRKIAYFDDKNRIWNNPIEAFPYRFLFEPHPDHEYLAKYDANIEVRSLYELIDRGEIKSLVTLENEQNIEARGVRKILVEDAKILISLLYRDFKYRRAKQELPFVPYNPPNNVFPLRNCIYKVGQIENAIKAVLMHELAYNPHLVRRMLLELDANPEEIDFVNEFFIAQTTRKSIDIYIRYRNSHVLVEVKTDKVDESALEQALYYRDLLSQRSWVDAEKDEIKVVLVGKRFTDTLQDSVKKLTKVNNGVRLVRYKPLHSGTWGEFESVY